MHLAITTNIQFAIVGKHLVGSVQINITQCIGLC